MCSSIPYHLQMGKYWSRARANHKTQIIRVIQSFSKKEFAPENPADIQKANLIGQEFVRKYYPGRQALVCTQTDGIGGCVHNHILINDVSMIDNKGCTKEQYFHFSVRLWTDEITEKYTVLDFGEGKQYADKLTEAEKSKHKKDEYCWKDDLREHIAEAMESAVSEEDFIKRLADNGVKAEKRYRGKNNNYYLVYELLDISKISEGDRKRRVKFKVRDRKLGIDYGLEALNAAIEINNAEKFSSDKLSIASGVISENAYDDVKKIISEEAEKIDSIQQHTPSDGAKGYDYEPSRKKESNFSSKNEETRAVVSPEVHEVSNENTKLNLNILPIFIEDILNDEESENKNKHLNIASGSKSVNASTEPIEQPMSTESETLKVPEEVSDKDKKFPARKSVSDNKAMVSGNNIYTNWGSTKLSKAIELTKNIQYDQQDDDEFSR